MNPHRVRRMGDAGKLAVQAHSLIRELIRPDMRTDAIDAAVEAFLRQNKAFPSFKHHRGFPAATAICVNEEVIHGLPGARVLQDGDLVTVDIGVYWLGYHVEMAQTYGVGAISDEAARLMQCAEQAIAVGIEAARAGNLAAAVGNAIQPFTEAHGFTIAHGYGGHGIGKRLHEAPYIPNHADSNAETLLRAGMTLAIEPIVCAGNGRSTRRADGWTIVSEDGTLSAHVEHTVVVMPEGGAHILTA